MCTHTLVQFSERAELLKLRAVLLQPRSADALEWQMRWEEVDALRVFSLNLYVGLWVNKELKIL